MKKLLTFLIFILFISPVMAADGDYGAGTFGAGAFDVGTITPTPPTTSSGGGGGGGGGSFTATFQEDKPRTFMMIKNKYSRFKVNGIQHTMRVTEILNKSITLEIRSEPTLYILNINETKRIDVDKDGTIDLMTTLTSIKGNLVYIKFEKATEEVIPPPTENITITSVEKEPAQQPEETSEVIQPIVPKKNYGWGIAITVVIIVVIILLVLYFKNKKVEEEYTEDN